MSYFVYSGANLLAVNADGNMPYDICEEEACLEEIEGEMARRGVTQLLIDETRASTEMHMLADLIHAAAIGQDLETPDANNATPVLLQCFSSFIRILFKPLGDSLG
jgi:protein phosphatase 1 regulatory subunit 16A